MERFKLDDRGLILAVAVPILLGLAGLGGAGLHYARSGLKHYADHRSSERAFYIAEGGLEAAMARLHADRQTAGTNLGYTATASGSVDGSPYTYTIAQDAAYPTDPTRKSVTSVGTVGNQVETVASQVAVFPITTVPTTPTTGGGVATCDWAIFAHTGEAEVRKDVGGVTAILQGGVHSNNSLLIKNAVGAALNGSGRFQAIGNARVDSLLSVLSTTGIDLLAGSITYAGIHLHVPLLGINTGIHFANGGGHGVQQAVSRIPFPYVDWRSIEQAPGTIVVDATNVPFGSWNSGTNTWTTSGLQIFPHDLAGTYFVRGNVDFSDITLARESRVTIAALGAIEIDQLSLLQTAIGGILPVGLNTTQTLRLLAKDDVFVGRGLLQSEVAALGDTILRPGVNLTAGVLVHNRIAAYSETGDVWFKSSAVNALTQTSLNLVGWHDATYAALGSLASTPTTFCQGAI